MSAASYVNVHEKLAPPVDITLKHAYAELERLMEPGVSYSVEFDDVEGMLFKRFSRTLPVEVWLVAVPIGEDGRMRHDKDLILSCIGVGPQFVYKNTESVAAGLRAELAELKAS